MLPIINSKLDSFFYSLNESFERSDSYTTDSSYYKYDDFIVRFSDHIHGSGRIGINVSVSVVFNKKDCFVVQLNDSPMPLVMNWNEVIETIKTSFYSYVFYVKNKEVEEAKILREIDTCEEWGIYAGKICERYPKYQFISPSKKAVFKEYFDSKKLNGLKLFECIKLCVETLGIKRCDTVKPEDVRTFIEIYISKLK